MNENIMLSGRQVALVCQYYPPEGGAAANRMSFFKHWLTKHGAKVTVITAMPNYPEGIIHKEYRHRFWIKENMPWGLVLRSWCYTSQSRSAVNRLLNYFTFMITSFRWFSLLKKCDVVVFSSGPMFAGLNAFLAAKFFKTKVILDARDLWPDRIWESGAIHLPDFVVKMLRSYENFMYRHSTLITCATKGVSDAISKRLDPEHRMKVKVIRNCDQNELNRPNTIKNKLSEDSIIKIVDAGTHGWAQDPENLCFVFKNLLSNGVTDISLSFAGSGPRVDMIKENILKIGKKAKYVGNLSQDELWLLLSSSDIGVVTLKESEHNQMTVSRRVFDYARAGLAIIYCGTGEGADIVHNLDAGIVIPGEDSSSLADVIEGLVNDRESLNYWKSRSGMLLEGELSQESIGENFVQLVHDICGQ